MTIGTCALCLKEAQLRISHILPKFVFQDLKETSPTAIREINKPNLRVQDFLKLPLLCSDCEELFSKWEHKFSEKIYDPFHTMPSTEAKIMPYDDWAIRFAVSISWRALYYYKYKQPAALEECSPLQNNLIESALEFWKEFLLGKSSSLGKFNQHIVPFDPVKHYSGDKTAPYLNRYLMRSVGLSLIVLPNRVYTYAKLRRLLILGRIQDKHPEEWKDTEIAMRRGNIGKPILRAPYMLENHIIKCANRIPELDDAMSPKQKAIIQSEITAKADRIANSEVFEAFLYDLNLFGDEAFKQDDTPQKIGKSSSCTT